MTRSMKAAWYDRTGPAREVLHVGEIPTPSPGAGEVRVRVQWSGVNPSDVKRRAGGGAQGTPTARTVPHMDGSGIIDAVGPGVDAARVGQRVWLHRAAWKRSSGTAAQWTVVPQERAVELPEGIDLRIGATLGVPALTAHRAVFGFGAVRGRTVLVTGGAGAVGFYAIQLARWGGARVLATASGGEKSQQALRAGADAVIDYRNEDVAARAMALTASAGVDHVVEVDFRANLPATLALIRPHGTIAAYASMGDPQPRLPFYAMQARELRLLFVALYDLPADVQQAACADVNAWLSSGSFQPPRLHELGLDDIVRAHEMVEAGCLGKVVLRLA